MGVQTNKKKIDEYKVKAKELVSKMTLEEKVSQMLHKAPAIERLGIPAYNWWNESLHGVARSGVATMFPQAIGMAAAFDTDMMKTVGDAIATEARAKFNMQQKYGDADIYKGLTFWAPNVNIFRDPRWGRGHETYGEDPYLTGELGKNFVEGLQGDDENYLKVAACAKHFAVHSGPEDVRHHFDAVATKQDMAETYLPAFEKLVCEAKVETVMGAYNRTNGEPCCGSKTLLKDTLRDKWGFDGHVVSDCWAIKDFHEGHLVTNSEEESVSLAVNNGCDINCGNIFVNLVDAVKDGMVDESTIDQAVERLFVTRYKLGIMGNADGNPYADIPYTAVDTKEMQDLNVKVAEKCVVLLKNANNALPLNLDTIGTIGVIGPNANNRRALKGNYEGTASRYVTVLEGIQDYVGDKARVLYSEGCALFRDRVEFLAEANDRISEVKGICAESDVVIAVMGLDSGLEGEEGDQGNAYASGDKPGLELPGLQNEVIKTICESGKKVIIVVLSGSALALGYANDNADAVLEGWYPGSLGGKAIANILFGDTNPQGKLPVTFYQGTDSLPEFTDYSMKNRTYRYLSEEPLYPFGYGLSYSDFDYSDLKVDKLGDTVQLTFNITNNSKCAGVATPQAYVKRVADNTPNAQLKAFDKVALAAGECKAVKLSLDNKSFALSDENGDMKVESGAYKIYVGDNQPDSRSKALTGKDVLGIDITI